MSQSLTLGQGAIHSQVGGSLLATLERHQSLQVSLPLVLVQKLAQTSLYSLNVLFFGQRAQTRGTALQQASLMGLVLVQACVQLFVREATEHLHTRLSS